MITQSTARDEHQASCAPESAASPYLEGLRALPTLPSVLFRFLGLVANSTVSDQQLADFIWKDPALLARAIPLVQAATVGHQLPGDQLRRATVILGRHRIRNFAYTTPLLRSLDDLPLGFHSDAFWERCALCAQAAEALAHAVGFPVPEQCYVAGLLHDIGYLPFLQRKPASLRAGMARWAAQGGDLLQIESEVMGIDHCRLGLELALHLGLDSWLHPVIAEHHRACRDSDWITRITCVAGAFCSYKGVDFFPIRSVAPQSKVKELEEVIRGLLPEQNPERIRETMEETVPSLQTWFLELTAEFESAGRKRNMGIPPRQAAAACSA